MNLRWREVDEYDPNYRHSFKRHFKSPSYVLEVEVPSPFNYVEAGCLVASSWQVVKKVAPKPKEGRPAKPDLSPLYELADAMESQGSHLVPIAPNAWRECADWLRKHLKQMEKE